MMLPLWVLVRTIIILAASLLFACDATRPGDTEPPVAEAGTIDLRDWDFNAYGPVRLDGEWEFFHQRFLVSEERASKPHGSGHETGVVGNERPAGKPGDEAVLQQVPLPWNRQPESHPSSPLRTYGSYRISVRLPEERVLLLGLPQILSSYRLYLDGRLIASSGDPGRNRADTVPRHFPKSVSFFPENAEAQLVVEVANYSSTNSGIWKSIEIGNEEHIRTRREHRLAIAFVLLGSILIMAIYHFVLFALRRDDRSSLYFGIFALLIAARILVTDQYPVFLFFPDASMAAVRKLELAFTFYLAVVVLLMFIRESFPRQLPYLPVRVFQAIGLLFAAGVLVLPVHWGIYTLFPYQAVAIVGGLFAVVAVSRALIEGEEGAGAAFSGMAFLFVCALTDILRQYVPFPFLDLTAVGLLVFLLFQSFTVSQRFSHAFDSVKRLSERLVRNDKLKDEFLANTSHELKTPLHGIIGLADGLRDGTAGDLPVRANHELELISAGAKRLSNLVNDILDASRLKNRDIVLSRRPVDIRTLAEVVLEHVRPLLGDKPISLKNDVPDNLPPVFGDEERLQQILHNLLGNAVKFTDSGTVAIRAQCEGDAVRVDVYDTGCGIEPNDVDRIFEPFEQADMSATREHGGTGIGLSITKSLVELHGGSIEVDSEPGKGSVFSFSLPVHHDPVSATTVSAFWPPSAPSVPSAPTPRDAPFHEPSLGPQPPRSAEEATIEAHPAQEEAGTARPSDSTDGSSLSLAGQSELVLIVDDDPLNRHVLENHLRLRGYRVRAAGDGSEALRMVEESADRISVILLDVMMPKMSGYETLRRIRTSYSHTELPVILLTVKDQMRDMVEGFSYGANDYLTKPVARDELLARIRAQINISQVNYDALTGAASRRFFDEALSREWYRALRSARPLALVMIDIDCFKLYNDSFGHPAGDDCLRRIADTVSAYARRAGDPFARYGGEEFAVLLPDTSAGDAASLAERMRRDVEAQSIPIPNSPISSVVTISLGITSMIPQSHSNPKELLHRADQALYQAKQAGRNRVVAQE